MYPSSSFYKISIWMIAHYIHENTVHKFIIIAGIYHFYKKYKKWIKKNSNCYATLKKSNNIYFP